MASSIEQEQALLSNTIQYMMGVSEQQRVQQQQQKKRKWRESSQEKQYQREDEKCRHTRQYMENSQENKRCSNTTEESGNGSSDLRIEFNNNNNNNCSTSDTQQFKLTDFFKFANNNNNNNNNKNLNEKEFKNKKKIQKITFCQKSLDVSKKKNLSLGDIHNHNKNSMSNSDNQEQTVLIEENKKLCNDINIFKNKICELELLLKEKNLAINNKDEQNKILVNQKDSLNLNYKNYSEKSKKCIIQALLSSEKDKRNLHKINLNYQKQRLGESYQQREGAKFIDIWMDGYEIKNTKDKLNEILLEKEEIEKQKKSIKPKKSNALTPNQKDFVNKNSENNKSRTPKFSDLQNNQDSNEQNDNFIEELKNRLNLQSTILSREETNLREVLKRLEAEKFVFIQEQKKKYEEDQFSKPCPDLSLKPWPLIDNRYQILSLLGKGGFSEVYKAYDLEELQEVACKVHQLNPNWSEQSKSNYIKHALRETKVHQELNHPNIVKLYGTVEIDENSFCTILEYCEGPDLSLYLKKNKMLPEKETKQLIEQILQGLKYLNTHKIKIIHYDLKPQNIIFHKGLIKITDFGLCKTMDPDVTRVELTSQGVGTYWYLPPETFVLGDTPPEITPKVDVWSLGVIFFEILYGQRPFGHNMSQERVLKEGIIVNAHDVVFPSKPTVSPDVKNFIKKCLAYYPEDRYSVEEAFNAFQKKILT